MDVVAIPYHDIEGMLGIEHIENLRLADRNKAGGFALGNHEKRKLSEYIDCRIPRYGTITVL